MDTGSVHQLNVSNRGVPKRPVAAIVVRPVSGVDGDVQAKRVHHGRPWQALSLWSLEVIEALQAEGHPIAAGSAGENVTIAGLDWADVVPGARLRLGDEAIAEVTVAATPCTNNAQWFADRDFRRIDNELHPGWSRMYAAVLAEGTVRVGDGVVIESIEPTHLDTADALNARWGGW
jgi:MOSC domain-containing protein YiiM